MRGREQDLVAQARRGDSWAFEQLALLYKDRLYNYILRMVGDPTEAEDLAQEALLRAFVGLARFRGAASFSTWMYRIASNLCVDALRRRQRDETRRLELDAPMDSGDTEMAREVPDAGPTPDETLEARELQRNLEEAIAALSPKLREVVVLFDVVGVPYEQIAQIVGCPLGTVKSRLFNARMQLREALRPYVEGKDASGSEL
jgi:RNA polymerase sigma-70 factor (ECF subfamily)